jgi:hypothetical protein
MATFFDADGAEFAAPEFIFILEHRGDAVDESESNPLAYFYDEIAANRELARLQGLEYAAFLVAQTAECDRVSVQVAALTTQEKANFELAAHARRSGKGERRAARQKLLEAGVNPDWLSDPRPYLRGLEEELALDGAAYAERHSVYSLYRVEMDTSDTQVEDPAPPRGTSQVPANFRYR